MPSHTGENDEGLRKIIDMTRLISVALLILHSYYYCYAAFKKWNLTAGITDRLIENIGKTGLFINFNESKIISVGFLVISLLGAKSRKNVKLSYRTALGYLLAGLLIYFFSYLLLRFDSGITAIVLLYMGTTSIGFILMLTGGTLFSRVVRQKFNTKDVFNTENETFPQEERLIQNDYSINLPASYNLKGRRHKSWINIINPFRGILVSGSPGSGKSYFIIRHVITQHIRKGFTMFVYDFKFDDLTRIAYNTWLEHREKYPVIPAFYIINFDDLSRTHRCNPLDPASMSDITDASESARTILMGVNREWIKRQGDFFVESPINFLSAVIWYLRNYRDGEFCTLPHVIELIQADYESLFTMLRAEKEIEALISPFISAFLNGAMEQLEGQIAAAKVSLARLSSPQLYYVMSGNDFTLDINNPKEPKIICMGNNPQKIQIYGAVLSLYITRLVKQVNKKNKLKSSLIFDEFPTIYLNHMDSLIATARSNKVSTTLGIQDLSQLRKDYGKEYADVIMNITGNIISGQVSGETAKQLSERFGKIMQDRESLSVNSSDTSISHSKQLEAAIPPSKISALSSGEFVGMVADDPDKKIELKAFYCQVLNDHEVLKKEQDNYKNLPVIRKVDNAIVQRNYVQIKQEVQDIVNTEVRRIISTPGLKHLVIKKAAGR